MQTFSKEQLIQMLHNTTLMIRKGTQPDATEEEKAMAHTLLFGSGPELNELYEYLATTTLDSEDK